MLNIENYLHYLGTQDDHHVFKIYLYELYFFVIHR